jgi:hypothetical protein
VETAAFIGAVISYLQDAAIDHAHFYRGDAAWMGLFDLQGNSFKTAYAFQATGKMLDTPQRLAVEGTDTFGFAALAGRSTDGQMVQVLISNYAIPGNFKPVDMPMPVDVQKWAHLSDFSKFKFLAHRTDIVYRDNAGYELTVNHLPWGNGKFVMRRYRLDKTRNMEMVEEKHGAGDMVKLQSAMPPEGMELIVLERD